MPNQRKKPGPKTVSDNQGSFEPVPKRLGADEDKAQFEARLGKIAKVGTSPKQRRE